MSETTRQGVPPIIPGSSKKLPEGYVQSINGATGQGPIGSFDRLVAGTISLDHRRRVSAHAQVPSAEGVQAKQDNP
jgi:hypothetical protein